METKDLVLLMMIPALLVGIIFYTDFNSITGAVIASDSESKVIGTYSIMPSFRANIDYSLKDYRDLNDQLRQMVYSCKDNQDFESCAKNYMVQDAHKLDWKCPESEKDILNDFVDKFNECANLKAESAVCRFSFDGEKYINDKTNDRNFEIIVAYDDSNIKTELTENGKTLAEGKIKSSSLLFTGFNDKDTSANNADVVNLKLNYNDGKPTITAFYATKEDGARIDLSKIILIYKSKDSVKFIDFANEASFKESTPFNKIIDLPKTKGMNFCAKTGKQAYAYDESDKAAKLRDIIYNFAVTFTVPPPEPISNLEIKKVKNTAAITLVWDKPDDKNINSYSLYYSTEDFINKKMEDIKNNPEIKKNIIQIPTSEPKPIIIDGINLDECNFDSATKIYRCADYNLPLLKNRLYWINSGKYADKYFFIISDAKDDVDYYYAVTALNEDGEEIDNDQGIAGNNYILKLNENYAKFKSEKAIK